MTRLFGFLLAAALLASAAEESSVDKRLTASAAVMKELMGTPDRSIPRDLLARSQCIVVIPGLKKGAFVFGGKYGRGFAACRHGASWGAPAAVRIEGGSFGLQIGGSSTDVILLVMNRRGMDRLTADKFTLGGEAAAAAGPVGRHASANTDVTMRAEILSWSRSQGVFAGLSLEGATLRPDSGENEKLYGKPLSNGDILVGRTAVPARARVFTSALNRYIPAPTRSGR